MASTTALFTGLSGLTAHAQRLDVIGNNIANVNTVAFKSSRLSFESQFAQTFSLGSAPDGEFGGTNPGQIGLGVRSSSTQRDFSTGSLTPTGDPRDLSIEGEGLFVVQRGDEQFYTRNGAFRLDRSEQLVTGTGEIVQGFGVNDAFQVQPGVLQPISLPVGRLRIAEATTRIDLAGNLNAGGDTAQTGGLTRLFGSPGLGFTDLSGAPITAATPLTQVADPNAPAPPPALFTAGQRIELTGVQRGTRVLPGDALGIDGATTVGDLLAFFDNALGIHSTGTPNPDGVSPGSTVSAGGVIEIVSNTGSVNSLTIDGADIRLVNTDGTLGRLPFVPEQTSEASGESIRSTTVAFDSLGNPVVLDVAFVLVSKNDGAGTTWRYDLSSQDHEADGIFIGTGTVDFDATGRPLSTTPLPVPISRDGTGAVTPLTLNLFLAGPNGEVSALRDTPSEFAGVFRDGLPAGVLEQFGVGVDGLITGTFSNGATRTLGQIALATFTNQEGLIDSGGGLFIVGANSGDPIVGEPGALNAGQIVSGSLELSNVDLGREFIELILTSTGYSASSRVIRTADELIQQLLLLGR